MLNARIAAGLCVGLVTAILYAALTKALLGWETDSQLTLLAFALGALGGIWVMTRR